MWSCHPDLLARPVPRYTSYPTAAEFSAAVGSAQQEAALARIAPDEPVSLYAHIPFCEEICWYCGCNTGRANRAQRLTAYLDALCAEVETVAGRLGGRGKVGRIAFGGGSPNALSPDQFMRLLATMRRAFDAEGADISIELDPRTTSADWFAVLGRAGVTRASLGVQTFDTAIQEAIGRVQPREMIVETVAALRAQGVSSINFDLMYGLPGQDRAHLSATLDETLALAPERIALFGYAHVPHLLPRQRRIRADNLPDQAERFAMAALGHDRLVAAGYVAVGFDHFALPHDPLALAAREGRVRRNFQGFTDDQARILIGLGATAISEFPDLLVQNEKNSGRYRMGALAGLLTGERGVARDREDQRRAAIIADLLCGRAANVGAFLGDATIGQGLAPFLERGLASLEGEQLRITEEGRPYGRVIAVLFDRWRTQQPQRFSTAI
ncbi:oxygen-independent coproporphyrinogen III oxidase [Sphingobium sp. SYK-6]|uniref:oxygen-independent coproporphyrinogen III oxidase n=1 Tax=Sphingobium sp. (strain NBRC 103272 / SYK-6) TaxID=627192 RepID=UPI0002277FD5|nr:oxygen-independent coproporphyrinogen III oxidase [Sphingobium sp. SYK-6]BAK68506.1 oxygen-independent coproporphyrinogen III oxidase [Sphingobium sp. SYK-6]